MTSELIPPAMAALAVGPQRGQICNSLAPLVATGSVQFSITIPPNATRVAVYIWDRFGEFVRTLVDEANPSSGPQNSAMGSYRYVRTSPSARDVHLACAGGPTESRLVQMR